MKSTILSLAFAAGLATAQLQDVPDCAVPCVTEYTTGNQIADCGQFDIACICSNKQFLDGIACCLEDACDQEGRDQAVNFARQICSTQDVEVPDEVVCNRPNSSASEESSTTAAETTTTGTTATETPATETGSSETTSSEATSSETSSTQTPTTSDGETNETNAPDGAAPGVLAPAGGILGAVIALMVAL